MTLYWPKKKVALDITDDPDRNPFSGDDSYTVLTATFDDLSDKPSYARIKQELLDALGTCYISDPVFSAVNDASMSEASEMDELVAYLLTLKKSTVIQPSYIPDDLESIEIIARSDIEGAYMAQSAKMSGQNVRGVTVWDGPVPEGSFVFVSPTMRMSTAEYFFLRKANTLPLPKAVELGLELCGKYRTMLSQYDLTDDYQFLRNPRTTKTKLSKYLRGCADAKEGRRAKRVLRFIGENCPSPACAWFFMMLSFPASHGGYGLPMPEMAKAFSTKQGYLPPANGAYVIYDLSWEEHWVSLQYAGTSDEGVESIAELQQGKMRVIFVSDECMRDPDLLDDIAHRLSLYLHCALPTRDNKWLEFNSQLRERVPAPNYTRMRLTMSDIGSHIDD